jgi:hypothetical protein
MGERLLTTPNPESDADRRLFDKLGMRLMEPVGATAAAGHAVQS